MKVVVANGKKLDLGSSLLNEDHPSGVVDGHVLVTGAGLFDDDEKLLPLASDFLSNSARYEKLSFTSVETYARNIGYFWSYLKARREFQSSSPDEVFLGVRRHVIEEYFSHLNDKGLDSATIRNRDACIMAFISGFLCSAHDDRPALRQHDPYSEGFISKAPKRGLVESCSEENLRSLIKSTNSERERCLLQFIYDAGVRRSEIQRITLKDINSALSFEQHKFIYNRDSTPSHPDYCPLLIKGSKGRSNETKDRYSIISRASLMRVKHYHSSPLYKRHTRKFDGPENTPAFFNTEGSTYTPSAINKLFERISKRAIKTGLIQKAISPHKLRHGNAYAILNSQDLGIDFLDRLVIVQKSLGHTFIKTTENYTHIPHEIYKNLCDKNGEIHTRAQRMETLAKDTQLKILIGDKK